MSKMIERGAEAMRAKRRELINQPLDRIWPDLMRAAIEAMHEPTRAMIEAGADGSGENSEAVATGAWEFMIAAALNEPPSA